MRIAVGIAHAAWNPERRESLKIVLKDVPGANVFASKVPESSEIWAKRLWRWGAKQDVDIVIYLNDDIELCDNFLQVVWAMWHGEPLSLHTSAPNQKTRYARCFWMTGPAYVLSPRQTGNLLLFCDRVGWEHNEDNMGSKWSQYNKTPFMSFIPCPVRHRINIPSTLGYDDHPHRVTRHFMKELPIRSDLWEPSGDVPLLRNPWL